MSEKGKPELCTQHCARLSTHRSIHNNQVQSRKAAFQSAMHAGPFFSSSPFPTASLQAWQGRVQPGEWSSVNRCRYSTDYTARPFHLPACLPGCTCNSPSRYSSVLLPAASAHSRWPTNPSTSSRVLLLSCCCCHERRNKIYTRILARERWKAGKKYDCTVLAQTQLAVWHPSTHRGRLFPVGLVFIDLPVCCGVDRAYA